MRGTPSGQEGNHLSPPARSSTGRCKRFPPGRAWRSRGAVNAVGPLVAAAQPGVRDVALDLYRLASKSYWSIDCVEGLSLAGGPFDKKIGLRGTGVQGG